MAKKLICDPVELRRVCAEASSMTEAAAQLQLHFDTFKRLAVEAGCYAPKYPGGASKQTTKEELVRRHLRTGSNAHISILRKQLIKFGLKSAVCEECGLSEWRGEPIPLELHHKDGNHYNNTLDNLEMVCPTCHAQLTRGSNQPRGKKYAKSLDEKNNKDDGSTVVKALGVIAISDKTSQVELVCPVCKRSFFTVKSAKTKRVCCSRECAKLHNTRLTNTVEELLALFDKDPNYTKVAAELGVTGNAVKKYCKKLGIFSQVDCLIQQAKKQRGVEAISKSRSAASRKKSSETRRANLPDFVAYQIACPGDELQLREVHRFRTREELEAAGFNYPVVCKACRGARKSYKGYIWLREGELRKRGALTPL